MPLSPDCRDGGSHPGEHPWLASGEGTYGAQSNAQGRADSFWRIASVQL